MGPSPVAIGEVLSERAVSSFGPWNRRHRRDVIAGQRDRRHHRDIIAGQRDRRHHRVGARSSRPHRMHCRFAVPRSMPSPCRGEVLSPTTPASPSHRMHCRFAVPRSMPSPCRGEVLSPASPTMPPHRRPHRHHTARIAGSPHRTAGRAGERTSPLPTLPPCRPCPRRRASPGVVPDVVPGGAALPSVPSAACIARRCSGRRSGRCRPAVRALGGVHCPALRSIS
jgi:hypothetical protein